jgi:Outer membrane protein beta-barrel domain
MANINGSNIDDLFRQASDHYPLRTDSADWAKLSDALEKDPSLTQSIVNEQEKGRRRRRFFLLFFLLPLAGAGYFFWHGTPLKNTAIAKEQPLPFVTAPSEKGSDAKGGPVGAAEEKTDAGTTTLQQHSATLQQPTATLQQHSARLQPHATTLQQRTTALQQHTTSLVAGTNTGTATLIGPGAIKPSHNAIDPAITTGDPAITTGPGYGKSNRSSGDENTDPQLSAVDVERALANQTYSLDITRNPGFAAPGTGAISKDALVSRPAAKKEAKPAKSIHPPHQIYLGLLGAPDLSTVKFQDIKAVGTTFGVLFGYSLNPKWSLETGLYLDRKKYFTEGQYFEKDRVPPLQYVTLLKVDGICNMFEIPVNIRYNLNPLAKNKWFATAGLSTYLMSQEQYAYQAMYNGMPWNKSATYNTPSQNWLSIVNLSIGYEQKLGRMTNLRLEPYLRVPLSGIGTGSLPIMSAGLNVGITRKIR